MRYSWIDCLPKGESSWVARTPTTAESFSSSRLGMRKRQPVYFSRIRGPRAASWCPPRLSNGPSFSTPVREPNNQSRDGRLECACRPSTPLTPDDVASSSGFDCDSSVHRRRANSSIARRYGVEPSLGGSGPAWVLQLAGLGLLVVGLTFFAASLRRFGTEGAGRSPRGIPRDGSCCEVRTATSAIR